MRGELRPGRATPLGAHWDGAGVNFALESAPATRVEVCLFEGERESLRFDLPARTGDVWHGYLDGLQPGTQYGLRVHGPRERGHRFDAGNLLVDPYARALRGEWDGRLVPRSLVVDEAFDWEGDRAPRTPWARTLLYELHVAGFSKRNPRVPEALRGTYAGLAHPASIEHLLRLGVTAVELLPVHAFVNDTFLLERGLTNYWGYSTLGFFAPAPRYAGTGCAVHAFKAMVKALHHAGIEVILDVVYNHTCEGDHRGPTLSLKGVDEARFYMRDGEVYRDVSGCGNSVHALRSRRLILDSLRYWVEQMHVDGFRFDLATTLGRNDAGDFDGALLHEIVRDPVLSHVKLIAEPWDLGRDGYQVGNFPDPMREWNDKYRDAVRTLWRGDAPDTLLGQRLLGSPDLYPTRPGASIDFVTAHDGYTLRDMVSYEEKHNHANGEGNRDGSSKEVSFHCGVEGETTRADVLKLRARQQRNLLATLMLSRGTPMLLAGDEMGRTQCGNNNPYCQDNAISWLDWELDDAQRELLTFTRRLVRFRRRWLREQGADAWLDVHGEVIVDPLPRAFAWRRGDALCLINASVERQSFVLPAGDWRLVLDTSGARSPRDGAYTLTARSLAVLTRR